MNLSHLRYFVKLAQIKHYTKTAELLCITQPSLSHAISQLEKELGVVLFEKGPRGTELTSFGKQFFASVNSSLNILDNGIETIKNGARGNGIIRIGCLSHMAQFPLNGTAHAMGQGADNGGPLYIFLIGQGRSVKHDIGKAGVDAVCDHIEVTAVIQV